MATKNINQTEDFWKKLLETEDIIGQEYIIQYINQINQIDDEITRLRDENAILKNIILKMDL